MSNIVGLKEFIREAEIKRSQAHWKKLEEKKRQRKSKKEEEGE